MNLAGVEKAVLEALLDILKERELIDSNVHSKAVSLVKSGIDFPDFFEYPVCCQKEVSLDESS